MDRRFVHYQRNPPHVRPRPVIADQPVSAGGLRCPGRRLIEAWTDAETVGPAIVSVKWRGQGQ
jgi:hypothetical protein